MLMPDATTPTAVLIRDRVIDTGIANQSSAALAVAAEFSFALFPCPNRTDSELGLLADLLRRATAGSAGPGAAVRSHGRGAPA